MPSTVISEPVVTSTEQNSVIINETDSFHVSRQFCPSVFRLCWLGYAACTNRPRNDLLCVRWHVKPYILVTHRLRG